jgi:integrase
LISQLTNFDLEAYKKVRLSEQAWSKKRLKADQILPFNSPATVNRELATISHLMNKAFEWGWIDRPPIRIHKLKEGNGRIVYLTTTEAEVLLKAAESDQNRQIYPFILIGLRTGMRKGEILAIQRGHVKLESRHIYVPNAKAGPRTQPISEDLADFLRAYIATLPHGTPWLFPSLGAKCGHTVDVRKAFVRVVTAAGLNPREVVRHTLRHTAITQLVQAGVDLPTVKRISGHKTMAMVERYAHQSGAHIDHAMGKLDARYRAASQESPDSTSSPSRVSKS